MNKFLLFIILLGSLHSFSQAKKIKVKKEKEKEKQKETRRENALQSMESIDVYCGNLVYKDKFYNQLNTGESYNFKTAPTLVGIGVSGIVHLIGPTYYIYQMDAQKYIPTSITINDSVSASFSGASFGLGIGKGFATKSNNLSIAYYLGFNSGRCTLTNSENISVQKQFFCPKISLHPKLMVKRLAISIVIAAQGDITSAKWLPTYLHPKSDVPISGLYQTGFIGLVSLGYRIGI